MHIYTWYVLVGCGGRQAVCSVCVRGKAAGGQEEAGKVCGGSRRRAGTGRKAVVEGRKGGEGAQER